MAPRQWVRRPGRLLVAFLVLTLLPACALGVLGWWLFQQDVALESRYVQDRLEHAADRLVAALGTRIDTLEAVLSRPDTDTGANVVVASFTPGTLEVRPPGRLLYYPPVRPAAAPRTQVFQQAETLEFGGNVDAAIAIFRQLAESRDPAVRAGALLRLARALRNAGRSRDALGVYTRLAAVGATPLAAGPADLIARQARSELLLSLGLKDEANAEAAALLAALRGGRWMLDRATFEFHARTLSRHFEDSSAGPEGALELSAAVGLLWERYRALGTNDGPAQGRESASIDGRPVLIAWRGSAVSMVGLAAGSARLEQLWRDVPLQPETALTLADVHGRVVSGDAQPIGPLAVRAAADTGLPWTIKVSMLDPGSAADRANARRVLLFAGLVLLSLVVAGGGTLVWRATARELAVAELQADFVSAVSHEFRTPLTSMRHLTELLEDGVVTSEDARRQYYALLSQETRRLHRLVEALLNFARMEAGRYRFRLEPTDPGQLAAEVVEEFEREPTAEGFAIRLDTRAGLICRIDRESLALAIWNLLDNAVKYSGDCRTIDVTVTARGRLAALSVRDGGLGIAAHERRAIFEKFVRGDSAVASGAKGTGLGLALVRHIVRAHGGLVDVAGGPGTGSTFTLLLPREGEPS